MKKRSPLAPLLSIPYFYGAYRPTNDSRCEIKSRNSSFVRGRSQVASCNTSLSVTGSIIAFVDSIVVGCLLFVLLLYVVILA